MTTVNIVFWGDDTGVHSATVSNDTNAAVTLANALWNSAHFGVIVTESGSERYPTENLVYELAGIRGKLSRADVGLS